VTSFATELATPTVTDVRTYGHLTALPQHNSRGLEEPQIGLAAYRDTFPSKMHKKLGF